MYDRELKRRLGQIVAQEELAEVDWNIVARLCDELAAETGIEAPMVVQEYLASATQRRTDAVFALSQRSTLVGFLRSGRRAAD